MPVGIVGRERDDANHGTRCRRSGLQQRHTVNGLELLQIALAVTVVAAPIVVLVRFIAGPDGNSIGDILTYTTEPSWPQGVQEEDPKPWKFSRAATTA